MTAFQMFISDLDGTLLGPPEETRAFHNCWEDIPEQRKPRLCYTSGRRLNDVLRVIQRAGLPPPDYIICELGTSIYDCKQAIVLKAFAEILDEEWDLQRVDEIVRDCTNARKKPAHHQGQYKSTWHWEAAAA